MFGDRETIKRMKCNDKGFTLIELIVVMAIIAILVLLAAPRFLGYTKDVNVTAMQQDTKVLSDAAEMYHLNRGEWPVIDKNNPVAIGVGGAGKLYGLNKDGLSDFIKDIKGNYDDYGIAVEGKYTGQVFHLEGVENKDDELHYNHGVSNEGYYSPFEIEGFMSKGYIPIVTADDLDKVRNNLDGNYIQVADIDLSKYSSGEGWEPIGEKESEFKGTYDGGGFKINNFKTDKPEARYQGLFGRTNGAVIKNANLVDINVVGDTNVGGLVGFATNTEISNVSVTGNIYGSTFHVGGLVGLAIDSSISNSYTNGSVKGRSAIGGLVGKIERGTSIISNSYSSSSVQGIGHSVGGILGLTGWSTTSEHLPQNSEIINTYATGYVNDEMGFAGGIIGQTLDPIKITNSYHAKESVLQDKTVGKGVYNGNPSGKLSAEMKKQSTYKGWDFNSIWEINEGAYPTLQWQK